MTSRLRVAVDARLTSGQHGGVEQVIVGLAHGLSGLEGDLERYEFIVFEDSIDWLRPHVSGPCSLLPIPRPDLEVPTWRHRAVRAFPRLAALRRRVIGEKPVQEVLLPVPISDGTVERMGFDLVHFTKQDGFLTALPSIYHPHDLQHVHLPEMFSDLERRRRDLWYHALCDQAAMVTVTSRWGAKDLIDNFQVDAGKVRVIPLAPVMRAYSAGGPQELAAVRRRHGLPEEFLLYPAQTWPHKNHVRLVQAVAALAAAGVDVKVVCPGGPTDHFPAVQEAVRQAGVQDSFLFLGYVPEADIRALFQLARGLVMPTLFEAAGGFGPVADAFVMGVPVACSNVTSLPEQVGDAAVLFDPYDVGQVAAAVESLWTDAELRERLVERGRLRISGYTWDRVARTFRAHYRRISGRHLSDEDIALMGAPTEF